MEDYNIVIAVVAVLIVCFVVWSRTRKRGDGSQPYVGTPKDPVPNRGGPGAPNAELRAELTQLTKAQIKAKAIEELDVVLPASLSKPELINEFIRIYRNS